MSVSSCVSCYSTSTSNLQRIKELSPKRNTTCSLLAHFGKEGAWIGQTSNSLTAEAYLHAPSNTNTSSIAPSDTNTISTAPSNTNTSSLMVQLMLLGSSSSPCRERDHRVSCSCSLSYFHFMHAFVPISGLRDMLPVTVNSLHSGTTSNHDAILTHISPFANITWQLARYCPLQADYKSKHAVCWLLVNK